MTDQQVSEYRLKKVTPTLAAAFNASRVNIDDDEDLMTFKDKFDALGVFAFSNLLGICDRETFAVEWMAFSNHVLFWTEGY